VRRISAEFNNKSIGSDEKIINPRTKTWAPQERKSSVERANFLSSLADSKYLSTHQAPLQTNPEINLTTNTIETRVDFSEQAKLESVVSSNHRIESDESKKKVTEKFDKSSKVKIFKNLSAEYSV